MSPRNSDVQGRASKALGWLFAAISLPISVAVWWSGLVFWQQLHSCPSGLAASVLLIGAILASIAVSAISLFAYVDLRTSALSRVVATILPGVVLLLYAFVLTASLAYPAIPPGTRLPGAIVESVLTLLPSVALFGATCIVAWFSHTRTTRLTMLGVWSGVVMLAGLVSLALYYRITC